MCGKNVISSYRVLEVLGSPPRVREKPQSIESKVSSFGITPACAGKTRTQSQSVQGLLDHPRVCGKNQAAPGLAQLAPGSPPRVREKRQESRCIVCQRGITPACAGKTLAPAPLLQKCQDHPRVCGKNLIR